MVKYIDLLSLIFLNKLSFFLKLAKNNITLIVSDIFLFKANFTINKSTTWLFYTLLKYYCKYYSRL